ncbi:MAG: hypothetical protein J6X36_09475 [Lachnospiraceae bacterium]|nr:hypothetical protein [Lachnospiraceae bacterium]
MGNGRKMKCNQCGFEYTRFEGAGFRFPTVYAETVEKAKCGELGEELKTFFEEHPDGAINAESVTLCCDECGDLAPFKDLTMYIPKEKERPDTEHGRWSVAMPYEGADYVTRSELSEYYVKYKEYTHKCGKCGGKMHIVSSDEKLFCPHCKVPMETASMMCWD